MSRIIGALYWIYWNSNSYSETGVNIGPGRQCEIESRDSSTFFPGRTIEVQSYRNLISLEIPSSTDIN